MSAFTGTLALARLALRRDRIQLPLWLLGLAAMLWANAVSIIALYDTEAERAAQAAIEAGNAVSLLFNGPALGTSVGAVTTVESSFLLIVLAPLMSAMAVVRHTRQNEETGRAELLGASVVGRHASLTAALLVTIGANLVLAALLALVLIANDLPTTSSVLAGAAIASCGIAFAGVAAVAAQVSESARGANGIAAAAIGVAFLIRAVGDTLATVAPNGVEAVSAWPSWLSPLGWAQQVRPFDDDRAWVLALPAVFFVGLVALAFVLTSHRDFGLGMLPVRRGPATAPPSLLSPVGLAWRLQRGVLAGWAVGVVTLGTTMGIIGDAADEILGASDQVRDLVAAMGGGGALVDTFFGAILGIFGIGVAGYTVQALLRTRAEESAGHLESLLATAVSRPRWMVSHGTCAVLGTVALLLLAGVSTGLGYSLAIGDFAEFWPLVGAALVRAPAALALAGFVIAVIGLVPRWATPIAWAGLAACLVFGWLGGILKLPQAVLDLSPFTHVPAAPAVDVTPLPLAVLVAVAVALAAVGIAAFRQRDLVDR